MLNHNSIDFSATQKRSKRTVFCKKKKKKKSSDRLGTSCVDYRKCEGGRKEKKEREREEWSGRRGKRTKTGGNDRLKKNEKSWLSLARNARNAIRQCSEWAPVIASDDETPIILLSAYNKFQPDENIIDVVPFIWLSFFFFSFFLTPPCFYQSFIEFVYTYGGHGLAISFYLKRNE